MSDNNSNSGEYSQENSYQIVGSLCPRCCKRISPKKATKYPKCNSCNQILHFQCSSQVAKTWNSLSAADKSTWTCINCCTSQTFGSTKKVRKHSTSSEDSVSSLEKRQKTTTKVQMATLEQIGELLRQNLAPINEKLSNIEENLSGRMLQVERECQELRMSNEQALQYSMLNNVVISDVPRVQDETLSQTVERISKALKVPVSVNDLDAFHWLPSKIEGGNPSFIMKFLRRWQKKEFIIAARKLRPTSEIFGGDGRTNVYVSEHLTPTTRKLLLKAKELKNYGYTGVRTMDCKVFLRKNVEGSRSIRIQNFGHVDKLIEEAGRQGMSHTQNG